MMIIFSLREIIKDLIIFFLVVPYHLITAFSMDSSDAVQYLKRELYFQLNKMRVHAITFHLTINSTKVKLTARSYHEELDSLEKDINGKKYKNTDLFLKDALTAVKKCMYVILDKDDSDNIFIQFHHGNGTYMLDFPLLPTNLNSEYSDKIIELLLEKGFKKYNRKKGSAFIKKTYTIYPVSDDSTTITADFGSDLKLALEVSSLIFKKIFDSKQIPIATFG